MELIQLNATLVIIIITGIISYKGFSDRAFFEKYKHYPVAEAQNKEWYRMLTSGFLHADWGHLIVNVYVLMMFGNTVEAYFGLIFGKIPGLILYVVMYVTCIIAADLPSYFKHKDNPSYGAIGASGAVSGVVFVSILFTPMSGIGIIFIPVYIPAFIFGIIYLIYTSWAARKGQGRIGHDAHFYGAMYGMLFVIVFHPKVVSNFIQQIAAAF